MDQKFPRLYPAQVCFVVDDVMQAVRNCEESFGWGPFQQFKAPIENANYRGWSGEKLTEVALGMAGSVQVEFIHVHRGYDAVGAYQQRYGAGFQHLGISCKSRDQALAALLDIGAKAHDQGEFPGTRFAFVDVPTGEAMFELLESTASQEGGEKSSKDKREAKSTSDHNDLTRRVFNIDRATIVTPDITATLDFYRSAFRWGAEQQSAQENSVQEDTLEVQGKQYPAMRFIKQAGQLELEIIQPLTDAVVDSGDPYAAHLGRGPHGLAHAGGSWGTETSIPLPNTSLTGKWLNNNECFSLLDWAGGRKSLQVRI